MSIRGAARGIFVLYIAALATLANAELRNNEPRHERIGRLALESIEWDWRTAFPGWDVRFNPGRPGFLGMTHPSKRRIDIWVRQSHGPRSVECTLYHEFTHAFDVTYMTDERRREWLRARGIPESTPWFNDCDACSDARSGSGDFAESVSWTYGPRWRFKSRLGAPPTPMQQELIRKWIAELPKMKAGD